MSLTCKNYYHIWILICCLFTIQYLLTIWLITISTHDQFSPKNLIFATNRSNSSCPKLINGILQNSINIANYSRNKLHIKYSLPLYLYSFGGSGNSWTRVLLEYITGISTGSVHRDRKYDKIFANEGHCNEQLLVCKAHPIWFYSQRPPIVVIPTGLWAYYKSDNTIIHESDGLIWLIRNPWHAIWSLYQLRFVGYKTHSKYIHKNDWNVEDFWEDIYLGKLEISLVEKWKMQFEIVSILLKDEHRKWNGNWNRIIQIKYENLLNKQLRINEMMKVIKHLYKLNDLKKNDNDYFVYVGKIDGFQYLNYDGLIHRIECAFEYNDIGYNVFRRNHSYEEIDDIVTMNDAYLSLGKERICKIWHSLLPYAKSVGYKQLFEDKFDCEAMDGFREIIDIDNVMKPNKTRFKINEMEEARKQNKNWTPQKSIHSKWKVHFKTVKDK